MRYQLTLIRMVALLLISGVGSLLGFARPVAAAPQAQTNPPTVHLTILHMNDVYEIMPVSGGTLGGVARVATLKKEFQVQNPNTLLTMSGDLHGPSGLGLAVVEGELLAGKQNVAVMNTVGIDYFSYGDHEFDIYAGAQHAQRLTETQFPMISSNVFDAEGNSFGNAKVNDIRTFRNAAGQAIRVGFFSITEEIPRSAIPLTYLDRIEATKTQVAALRGQVDILIAMTHQGVADDLALARQFPEIDLILGGDDHEHMKVEAGAGLAPIIKADSNARSVQVLDLYFDTASGELQIEDQLVAVTDMIANDSVVQTEINRWRQIAYSGFRAEGIEPSEVVAVPTVDLDGFANTIRNGPTEFTRLMLNGINATADNPDLSVMFSALIRMDDLIPAGGNFTMYDVIRTFPNNYDIVTIELPGSGLGFLLNFGYSAAGSGQYILTTDNVTRTASGSWAVDGQPLDPARIYRVGTTREAARAFSYFGATTTAKHLVTLQQLLIQQLMNEYGPATSGASQ
ncbi:MAG: metallophosphoesterase [Caldilineaceae bacterium]